MKSFDKSRISAGLRSGLAIAALALLGQPALACTTAAWSADTGVTVGGPEGNPATLARYSGLCAMQAATSVHVEDESPGGISRIRARFYMLADNTAEADVYRGFNGTGSQVFEVSVNPGNGNVTLSSGGTNATCTGCANAGEWNAIEIDWDAGSGALSLWVNSDATTDAADATASFSSSQTVSSVRLGNLNGAAGAMNFDSYESRRTTAIGRLVVSDANGDGTVNSQDIAIMVNELLGTSFAPGQVDCNLDGTVNSQDLACVVNILLG
jgi:hypothetical protein